MATYGEKVGKYQAIVEKALELGLEPDKKALKKLYYYVGRAHKKGSQHETKVKDKLHWATVAVKKTAKEILVEAAAVLAASQLLGTPQATAQLGNAPAGAKRRG